MRRTLIVTVLIAALLALGACASGGASGGKASSQGAQAEKAAKAPKGVAPPAGSKLARVQKGMSPGEVTAILGEPTSTSTYQTGMAWVPFYYGSDTMRTDYKYKGVGRVVFGHNRWSGAMKVTRIDYDPSEDGM
jgi:outer membrane protein assembly factor BamE (lipoprotein component of BamABCDE complex)